MNQSPVIINTERETRAFFWFLTVVLSGMAVWAIVEQPRLQQPLLLIPFILLMAVHIALHWLLRRFVCSPGWTIGYALAQGILASILVYLSGALGMAFGISMALVGEAIGVYGLTRRGFLACVYYLALSLGFYLWTTNGDGIGWWMLGATPMVVFVVIYVEMYSRQANANERAQVLLNELETANQQLSDYAAQVEDLTIATERQRMARELHDTLSQGLAGLILQLEAADAHLANSRPEKARQIVQQTMENARATLSGARRAIDDLRKSDSPGCEEAIRQEVSRFSATTGIPCAMEVDLPPDASPALADSLLRIVTEGLANVARHAQATRAGVDLRSKDGWLTLEIQDNGAGFDPSSVPIGHYGLLGMRERARLAGGTLEVDSQPGQGTTLRIRIPRP